MFERFSAKIVEFYFEPEFVRRCIPLVEVVWRIFVEIGWILPRFFAEILTETLPKSHIFTPLTVNVNR